MPVNIEIKGNLARLLATENLIVEHKKVETAQFNTQTRVLTLPIWNTSSNFVYDMLVAHEVGHALFTPCVDWKQGEYKSLPHSYVNIVEDARIERLMKNKFAGLNRDFYKGYEELNSNDFFELHDKNVNEMKFIDKINLYFKLGAFLCLEFNDIENQFITEISQAETFEQVLDISQRVYQYSKDQQQARQKMLDLAQTSEDKNNNDDEDLQSPSYQRDYQSESDDEIDDSADIDDPDFETSNEIDDDDEIDGNSAGNQAGDWTNIDQSDTQDAFDNNSEKLRDTDGKETTYINLPEVRLDKVVVPFDVINEYLTDHFHDEKTLQESNHTNYIANAILKDTNDFKQYKKSASKDVNHLVKEFEMKKSADSYARQSTARTGVLDTSKLHTYMFNEDIFKKISVIPEGKNHGLVFLLDWSGSMCNILENTLKQLYNLVWFCRKVNIPFEVYAFTNDSWSLWGDYNESARYYELDGSKLVKSYKSNDLHIEGGFRMVNILTSTAKSKDIDNMLLNLWLQTRAISHRQYNWGRKFTLSGTPLNEAILCVGQLTKQFIKNAKLQKSHVIILTDGDGYHPSYNHNYVSSHSGTMRKCVNAVPTWSSTIRVGSRSFICSGGDVDFTNKMVEAVKSTLPNTSFIGIRILDNRSYSCFYTKYGRSSFDYFEDMKSELRKNGAVFFKNKSFDLWCAVVQKSLHTDADLEVDQGAAKRQITAAFKKMNKGKRSNKFMVKEFIKQIA